MEYNKYAIEEKNINVTRCSVVFDNQGHKWQILLNCIYEGYIDRIQWNNSIIVNYIVFGV